MVIDEIGFTGTRHGMTLKQKFLVEDIIHQHFPWCVHLGDCVGADAEAHQICVRLGIKTIGHPPTIRKNRAFCKYYKELPPRNFIARNHDIVDSCKMLLACPKGREEEARSGTWATIRYAQQIKKPYTIIWFDGERFASW